jgi:hypothetical protein
VQRAGRGVNGIYVCGIGLNIYTLKAGTNYKLKQHRKGRLRVSLRRGIKQHAAMYGPSYLQLWVADVLGTVQRH